MRGEHTMFCHDACDSIRKNRPAGTGKRRSVALKKEHWRAVMEAGLSQFRVGRFDDGSEAATKRGQARTHLTLPPENQPELHMEFHNRLMMLCGVTLQAFADAIRNKASKKRMAEEEGAPGDAQDRRPQQASPRAPGA